MTQTIAEQIKWDFNTNGNLEIRDKNGNRIYSEFSIGYWARWEYDSKNNQIYFEDSKGYWSKSEYDSQGNEIYFENSDGVIKDKRLKPFDVKVLEIDGVKYRLSRL